MIEPAFQTLLVSTIGFTPLLSSCFLSAVFTAVSLSTITRSADVKRCPTPADPLAENDFGGHAVALNWTRLAPHVRLEALTVLCGASPLPPAQTPAVTATGVLLIGNVLPYMILLNAPPCADDYKKNQLESPRFSHCCRAAQL